MEIKETVSETRSHNRKYRALAAGRPDFTRTITTHKNLSSSINQSLNVSSDENGKYWDTQGALRLQALLSRRQKNFTHWRTRQRQVLAELSGKVWYPFVSYRKEQKIWNWNRKGTHYVLRRRLGNMSGGTNYALMYTPVAITFPWQSPKPVNV